MEKSDIDFLEKNTRQLTFGVSILITCVRHTLGKSTTVIDLRQPREWGVYLQRGGAWHGIGKATQIGEAHCKASNRGGVGKLSPPHIYRLPGKSCSWRYRRGPLDRG